jgi:HEAT repeat protein
VKPPVRQAAAWALMAVGLLAALPPLVKVALERVNAPESERGSKARLRSIRGDNVYPHEHDIY